MLADLSDEKIALLETIDPWEAREPSAAAAA